MNHLKLTSAACLFFLAACAASPSSGNPPSGPADGVADGSGPSERVFGTIAYYEEPIQATVPAGVQQGQSFTVTVVTYGGGCIEKGETDVVVEVLRAEVRPYDYDTSPANLVCTDELRLHEHTARLSFKEKGTAEIVFYGQKRDRNGTTQTSAMRTLEVR